MPPAVGGAPRKESTNARHPRRRSLAGATLPGKVQSDGINLLPFAQGKKSMVSRTFYWRQFQRFNQKAIRDGNWKYMQDEEGVEYLFDLGT